MLAKESQLFEDWWKKIYYGSQLDQNPKLTEVDQLAKLLAKSAWLTAYERGKDDAEQKIRDRMLGGCPSLR